MFRQAMRGGAGGPGRFGGGGPGGPGGPGDPAGPNVFRMQQRMFSIGDDFWIENGAGERVYKVDGKALRVRQTLILESPAGEPLFRIQEKLLRIRDTMDIEGPNGTVASVQQAIVAPLRQRFRVTFAAGGEWQVQGNILDHEYEISAQDGPVATVAKRWFRIRDAYGIEVAQGRDAAMVIAVAIVVDSLVHSSR